MRVPLTSTTSISTPSWLVAWPIVKIAMAVSAKQTATVMLALKRSISQPDRIAPTPPSGNRAEMSAAVLGAIPASLNRTGIQLMSA